MAIITVTIDTNDVPPDTIDIPELHVSITDALRQLDPNAHIVVQPGIAGGNMYCVYKILDSMRKIRVGADVDVDSDSPTDEVDVIVKLNSRAFNIVDAILDRLVLDNPTTPNDRMRGGYTQPATTRNVDTRNTPRRYRKDGRKQYGTSS